MPNTVNNVDNPLFMARLQPYSKHKQQQYAIQVLMSSSSKSNKCNQRVTETHIDCTGQITRDKSKRTGLTAVNDVTSNTFYNEHEGMKLRPGSLAPFGIPSSRNKSRFTPQKVIL